MKKLIKIIKQTALEEEKKKIKNKKTTLAVLDFNF